MECDPSLAKNITQLRQEIDIHLSAKFFKKNPFRIFYLFLPYIYGILHFYISIEMLAGKISWILWFFSTLLLANIGTFCFFLMHEILHGAIFKSVYLSYPLAFLGGIPFLCTPTIWQTWHNHHHKYTNMRTDIDRYRHPDYDSFDEFSSRIHYGVKKLNYKNILSYLISFIIIIGSHGHIFIKAIFNNMPFKIKKWQASIEYLIMIFLFLLPLLIFPLKLSLCGVYLPLILANLICNLYILSNHYDNILTEKNYPLVNTTSVFIDKYLKTSHLNFGRHVEHHLYPFVAHNKLKEVTKLLKLKYDKEQFKERSLFSVIAAIYGKRR